LVAIKNIYTEEISGAEQAFRTRMDAQCEEIEKYRLAVIRDEHRQLSLEQAAMEWIEKYAEYFSTDAGRL
jgi:hypothetical protein